MVLGVGVGVAELADCAGCGCGCGCGSGGVTMEVESEKVSDAEAAVGRSASATEARMRERVMIATPAGDEDAVAAMAEAVGVCSSGASEPAGGATVACAAASDTAALLPLGVLTATEREPESRRRIGCFFELETGDALDAGQRLDEAAAGGELGRSAANGCSRSSFCTKE